MFHYWSPRIFNAQLKFHQKHQLLCLVFDIPKIISNGGPKRILQMVMNPALRIVTNISEKIIAFCSKVVNSERYPTELLRDVVYLNSDLTIFFH